MTSSSLTATAGQGERPECSACPFWQPHSEKSFEGQCRRQSPRWLSSDYHDWAVTRSDDWCGDHPNFADWLTAARSALTNADAGEGRSDGL